MIPVGYQSFCCHLIFDKQEDFHCKAWLVSGRYTTDAPATITYASVISRETVCICIALLLAEFIYLEGKKADIENAYITAPCSEKIWTVLGPEFESDAGKMAFVVRALGIWIKECVGVPFIPLFANLPPLVMTSSSSCICS